MKEFFKEAWYLLKENPYLLAMFSLMVLSFLLVVIGITVGEIRPVKRDTTDVPGGQLSGMDLHKDHMTGCHYLSYHDGGLTPRLDANGNQVCEPRGI